MNYSELRDAITSYAHRDDTGFDNSIDLFIDLFESRANRELRCAEQETEVTDTAVSGLIALPADYLELRDVKYQGNTLQYVTPQRLPDFGYGAYTLVGNSIKTNHDIGLTYRYYASIPALSASAPSNWLLAAHQDAYLNGALAEFGLWVRDQALSATFAGLRDALIAGIKAADKAKRWSGAPLAVQPRKNIVV